jgi:hypothetical protein
LQSTSEIKSEERKITETPLLFIDINLGEENPERIIVFEGDNATDLSTQFCKKHNLDEDTRQKLEE